MMTGVASTYLLDLHLNLTVHNLLLVQAPLGQLVFQSLGLLAQEHQPTPQLVQTRIDRRILHIALHILQLYSQLVFVR